MPREISFVAHSTPPPSPLEHARGRRAKASISQTSSDSTCGPISATADVNVMLGRRKGDRGGTCAVSTSKQTHGGSGLAMQQRPQGLVPTSVGGRHIHWVAWIWTEAMCLEPGAGAATAVFPSFAHPQFSDHGTGSSYLGWHIWRSFLIKPGALSPDFLTIL